MRRLLGFITLAIAASVVLAFAPAVLADDPDCAAWRERGAPPGIDMEAVCTANQVIDTYTGRGGAGADTEALGRLGAIALLTGAGLAIVAVMVARFAGARAARRLVPDVSDAWWVCPGCQSINAMGQTACYACHVIPSETPGGDGPKVIHRDDRAAGS